MMSVRTLSKLVGSYPDIFTVLVHMFEGMLASAETIGVVADAFRAHKISNSVVDPVCLLTCDCISTTS